ncbi:MAG: dTDP-4-dehydrorhamnose 3,5-epimerase [Deltaproteobacteria bacterium]|nr:dTDP-4-dehydrorhamnose 3,5-epimerase [Deltaproteobacteria bacterium]
MKVLETSLPGVLIIEPKVFDDERGFFMETYHEKRYRESGIDCCFVQDNFSYSVYGTLRGLHYQYPNGQAKLVQVLMGEVFDVAVDIRRGSPTFGKWCGEYLSDKNRRQLLIPEGYAHGFCVLSETALFIYKCSDFYTPESERGILWSDPGLKIEWPVDNPLLSEKDSNYQCLADVPVNSLPVYA